MRSLFNIKPKKNLEESEFELTPRFALRATDESNIEPEILDEDAHAKKPCEISWLTWNMKNKAITKYKSVDSKNQNIIGKFNITKNQKFKWINDSNDESIQSNSKGLFTPSENLTLKMEVKHLLHAMVVLNSMNLRCKSQNSSKENHKKNCKPKLVGLNVIMKNKWNT